MIRSDALWIFPKIICSHYMLQLCYGSEYPDLSVVFLLPNGTQCRTILFFYANLLASHWDLHWNIAPICFIVEHLLLVVTFSYFCCRDVMYIFWLVKASVWAELRCPYRCDNSIVAFSLSYFLLFVLLQSIRIMHSEPNLHFSIILIKL